MERTMTNEENMTLEEVELQAAKQLLLELKTIKKNVYDSKTLINSILIIQLKQLLRGLIHKYNDYGLFIGENITLKLSNRSKHANIDFVYTQKLNILLGKVVEELQAVKPIVQEIGPVTKS
jgi:hypothetical protein